MRNRGRTIGIFNGFFASPGLILVAICLSGCGGARKRTPTVAEMLNCPPIKVKKCDGALPPLPDPVVWKVPWPQLTPEQRRKKQEVDQYQAREVCEVGWRIVAVTQQDNADIIDWIDPCSMESAFESDHPYEPAEYISNLPMQRRKIWPPPPYPAVRYSFSGYIFGDTGAASVEEWLDEHDRITRPPSIPVGPSQRPLR